MLEAKNKTSCKFDALKDNAPVIKVCSTLLADFLDYSGSKHEMPLELYQTAFVIDVKTYVIQAHWPTCQLSCT